MKPELEIAHKKLKASYSRLQNGVPKANNALKREGVLLRFKSTVWHFFDLLNEVLNYEGFLCFNQYDLCILKGSKHGFLTQEEVFQNILRDRNEAYDVCDEETVKEIFYRIQTKYLRAFEQNIKRLEQYLEDQED